MNLRKSARVISAVLLLLVGAEYLAAKIHFFTRYSALSGADYFHEHRIYWQVMAVTALGLFLLERLSPEKSK